MTQKTVPLRVRVTEPEAQKYRRAMQALGLTEISTFVRWALDNSSEAVLRGGVRPQAPAPAPEPVRMSRMPAPPPPAPVPGPVPTLADVIGVPLYGYGPRPVEVVDGDDWT